MVTVEVEFDGGRKGEASVSNGVMTVMKVVVVAMLLAMMVEVLMVMTCSQRR